MLLPNNKIPEWGASYSLADELCGLSADHPPSAFIQNIDDTTAPPQASRHWERHVLTACQQQQGRS